MRTPRGSGPVSQEGPRNRLTFLGVITIQYNNIPNNKFPHRRAHLLAASLLLLVSATALAGLPVTADLQVHVAGLTHQKGEVVAHLFRPGDDLFGPPFRKARSPIAGQSAVLVFPGLAPGEYALIAFHDENKNGGLDHNIFRLPAEPLGFSGGFRLGPTAWMPTFAKLRFVFQPASPPLAITLH